MCAHTRTHEYLHTHTNIPSPSPFSSTRFIGPFCGLTYLEGFERKKHYSCLKSYLVFPMDLLSLNKIDIYPFERDSKRDRESSYAVVCSLDTHNGQFWVGARKLSWELNLGLPRGWWECGYLSCHHCLPRSALTGNWSQE